MLAGRQVEIQAARDRKLEAARQQRQLRRRQAPSSMLVRFRSGSKMATSGERKRALQGCNHREG